MQCRPSTRPNSMECSTMRCGAGRRCHWKVGLPTTRFVASLLDNARASGSPTTTTRSTSRSAASTRSRRRFARRSRDATTHGTTTGSASAWTRRMPARLRITCSSIRAGSRSMPSIRAPRRIQPPTGCGRVPAASMHRGTSSRCACRFRAFASAAEPMCAWASFSSGTTAGWACRGRGRRWRRASGCSRHTRRSPSRNCISRACSR